MARLYTAKVIVSETQKAQIERLNSNLVSFSHIDGVGGVALIEYIEGTQDKTIVNSIINILDNAQVIQISRRTIASD